MSPRSWTVIAVTVLTAACADAPGPPTDEGDSSPAPDVVELVCERDGTASLSSPVVAARPDGVHLVVDNRFDEPVSVGGFDADPGVTRWTFGWAPGATDVTCWPYSQHGSGEEPDSLPIEIVDPDGLFVPYHELECDTDEQWTTIADFIDTSRGVDADPIEAAREALGELQPSDELAVRDSGYPDEEDNGTTVVVSRDGRVIAIVGLSLADDGRWYSPSSEGCAEAWPG